MDFNNQLHWYNITPLGFKIAASLFVIIILPLWGCWQGNNNKNPEGMKVV
jgi:hypothetical protein